MSTWLTAKECVSLPGMPLMEHNIRNKLEKLSGGNGELRRRREGSKAFEYHIDCLPDAAREAVQARMARELQIEAVASVPAVVEAGGVVAKGSASTSNDLALYRKCPALLDKQLRELTDHQKAIADARMTLVCAVIKLMDVGGMSRKAAVDLIATGTQRGTLSPEMLKASYIANARKGSTRKGVGKSSLQHWLSDYLASKTPGERMAVMAPGKIKAKAVESYPWMPQFLQHWRDPNQPSVTMAYERFVAEWEELHAGNELMMAQLPSVDTVRYALKKIPKAERMRGRVTGSAYQSLLPFVRRDWSQLPVNGVWIGDGHGMKLEVLHPETGKPFKPEITLVIDGRTRVVMGWSLAMSESHIAVGDAIRNAISNYGVPLIYYSDNGGGEKNGTFDADVTGIFSRLGITHPIREMGDTDSDAEATARARKLLSDSRLKALTITVTVRGMRTEAGKLWTPGQRVALRSDVHGIDGIFYMMSRTIRGGRNMELTTEMVLKEDGIWTPDAYPKSQHKKKGKKQDKYWTDWRDIS